jgi:hypothetical protein
MTANPLWSCRLKVNRAVTHFNQLNSEVDAFLARKPYSIIREIDPNIGQRVFKLHVAEKLPAEWSSLIGDCIHNARSSLDALAYALVRHGGGTPTDHTKFPIGAAKNNFAALKGASPAALRIARRLKPHKGGNAALNRLNEMSVIDKHRVIIPVATALMESNITMTTTIPGGGEPLKARIPLQSSKIYPLYDGQILGTFAQTDSVSFSRSSGQVHMPIDHTKTEADFEFAYQIVFGNRDVCGGESLTATLYKIITFTQGTIDLFARHIFKSRW